MVDGSKTQKVLVVGAGPVGALAGLYAAERGDDVHVYELRAGRNLYLLSSCDVLVFSCLKRPALRPTT